MKIVKMKLIWIAIVVVVGVMLANFAAAQDSSCPGRAPNQLCLKPKDVGRAGRGCRASQLWYFNQREQRCRRLNYLGCGGNENRFCTLAGCRNSCI